MGRKQPGKSEVIERGDVYFIFRPEMEQHEPKGVQDVEEGSFIIILKNPESGSPPRVGLRDDQKAISQRSCRRYFAAANSPTAILPISWITRGRS